MPKTVPNTDGERGGTGGAGEVLGKRKRPNEQQQQHVQGEEERAPRKRRTAAPDPHPARQEIAVKVDATGRGVESAERDGYFVEALRRIQQLQDEIDFLENDPYAEDEDDSGEDDTADELDEASTMVGQQAEALGFAVCARETIAFLQREGIPADSALMRNLRRRLIGSSGDLNLPC